MSEINWDEAPEGTTHYGSDLFYKADDIGKWASVYAKEKQKWMTSAFISNHDLSNMSFEVKPKELDDMGGLVITPVEHDEVQNPKHYDLFEGQQAIDFIKASLTPEEFAGYCKGNFLKYRLRAGEKGDPLRCLAKSDWYRDYLRGLKNE